MTAAANARRAAIVARAMTREGFAAALVRPGQGGYGTGTGATVAQQWPIRVIRLPLDLRNRDSNGNLGEADGMLAVESLQQQPRQGWEIQFDSRTAKIHAVEIIPSGTTDVLYLCGVQTRQR